MSASDEIDAVHLARSGLRREVIAQECDARATPSDRLERRQMISDVLRRGLDVPVREPTRVRRVEPNQPRLEMEGR